MIELDITWANPSEAQNIAFEIAMKQKPRNVTEFQAAEFICMADKSLWYIQAKNWAENPPNIGEGKAVWQMAAKLIKDIVDLGYDDEDKTWWSLIKLEGIRDARTALPKMLLLMDFGMMLKQYRQQSMDVVSRGFEIFLDIVLGKDWEKQYKQFLKKARKKG